MNKTKIDGIIVVEGTSDVKFLSSFIDAEFIITNGSEISSKTLNTIKELSKSYNIIILTDPDGPGKRIRDVINSKIDNCYNAFIDKNKSIKKNKVGVAESSNDEILNSLNNLHLFNKEDKHLNIKYSDLISFGYLNLNKKEFRNYLANKYHFDNVNTKYLIKRINMLNIPIEEEIRNYGK